MFTIILHNVNEPKITIHPITNGTSASVTFAFSSVEPIINCIPSIVAIITAKATPIYISLVVKKLDTPDNALSSIDMSPCLPSDINESALEKTDSISSESEFPTDDGIPADGLCKA